MPKKTFQCPFCSKKSTGGAGLASHIRSAHPEQAADSKEPSAPKPKSKTHSVAPLTGSVSFKAGKISRQSAGESTKRGSSAVDLLVRAVAQLSERKLAIEEELRHTEDLRNELETINRQVESLKTALGVFETSGAKDSPSPAVDSDGTEETQTEATTPAKDLEEDFTGNKRELITSLVDSRASEGITPKEIEGIFAQRKISKGRNLIYNFLSLAVQRGKMRRENGKYFPVARSAAASSKASRRRAA